MTQLADGTWATKRIRVTVEEFQELAAELTRDVVDAFRLMREGRILKADVEELLQKLEQFQNAVVSDDEIDRLEELAENSSQGMPVKTKW